MYVTTDIVASLGDIDIQWVYIGASLGDFDVHMYIYVCAPDANPRHRSRSQLTSAKLTQSRRTRSGFFPQFSYLPFWPFFFFFFEKKKARGSMSEGKREEKKRKEILHPRERVFDEIYTQKKNYSAC